MSQCSDDVLYIVIPAYNEEENICSCIDDWYPVVEAHSGNGHSRLVIVNDGSKDSTSAIVEKKMQDMPLLRLETKKNGGHGSSVLFGYRLAIKEGADFVFQTDSDGQTNPREFDAFWDSRNDCDAVIGNRLVRGDGKDRKFVENTVCALLKLFFGVKVEDANAPYRLMKTSVVSKYINRLPENYNLPNIMFTTYFVYYGEKVKFIPITFKPRAAGVNTINVKRIVSIGWNALGDFARFRKDMKRG